VHGDEMPGGQSLPMQLPRWNRKPKEVQYTTQTCKYKSKASGT